MLIFAGCVPQDLIPTSGWPALYNRASGRKATRQRTAILHAAFCPPFSATPQLEFHQLEGPPARIKPSQLFAHGVRLEVKLDRAATEATDVVVYVEAREPALD